MSDLISRQAAIDAYGDWYVEEGTEDGFIGTVKQLLEGLPSAQPERKNCESCRYNAYEWDEEPCDSCTGNHWKPSAQPERRTATWIEDSDPGEEIGMYWACSNCKHGIGGVTHSEMIATYHFCLYCGADMRGGEANETD